MTSPWPLAAPRSGRRPLHEQAPSNLRRIPGGTPWSRACPPARRRALAPDASQKPSYPATRRSQASRPRPGADPFVLRLPAPDRLRRATGRETETSGSPKRPRKSSLPRSTSARLLPACASSTLGSRGSSRPRRPQGDLRLRVGRDAQRDNLGPGRGHAVQMFRHSCARASPGKGLPSNGSLATPHVDVRTPFSTESSARAIRQQDAWYSPFRRGPAQVSWNADGLRQLVAAVVPGASRSDSDLP